MLLFPWEWCLYLHEALWVWGTGSGSSMNLFPALLNVSSFISVFHTGAVIPPMNPQLLLRYFGAGIVVQIDV